MAFDETLADRIRSEKKMFGGIAFLANGNMCCGVHGDDMIVRPMKGWIHSTSLTVQPATYARGCAFW